MTEPAVGSELESDPAPDLGPGARIIAVRHGATSLTGERLNGGARTAPDPPITAAARTAAQRAGATLRQLGQIDETVQVRSSPALRARQTAAAMGWQGAAADARLAEVDLGEWEGARVGSGQLGVGSAWWRDPSVAPPGGGESVDDVVRRLAPVLDSCAAGTTTVLVAHHGTLLAVLMHVLGCDLPSARALALPPGVALVLRRWADGGSCLDALLPPTARIVH